MDSPSEPTQVEAQTDQQNRRSSACSGAESSPPELLPCPFCGSDAEYNECYEMVHCSNRECSIAPNTDHVGNFNDTPWKADAAKIWNSRGKRICFDRDALLAASDVLMRVSALHVEEMRKFVNQGITLESCIAHHQASSDAEDAARLIARTIERLRPVT